MLQKLLADYVRRKYFGLNGNPIAVGVYRPSVLAWSCARRQFHYYKLFHQRNPEDIPDDIVLLLGGGVVFHRLVQSFKENGKRYWDRIEIECSLKATVAGSNIVLTGHADAIKGDTVYEFKHTRSIPWRKPKFDHQLQANFYMAAIEKVRGVVVYTGYNEEGGLSIREFPILFSDWHLEHLITRAQSLHTWLVHDTPPRCSCRDRRHEGAVIL